MAPIRTFLLVLLLASPAAAAPIDPTFSWNASSPGASPASAWSAEVGSHDWSVGGASHQSVTSALAGIDAAYVFDAGDAIRGPSVEAFISGGATGQRTSFEIWFRPDDLVGGPQVLFETGGRVDGLSFTLVDDELLFRVQDDASQLVSLRTDLASVGVSEFIQVVGTVELGGAGAQAELFVNGARVESASSAGILDWSGPGAAGIGAVNGRVGGTHGGGEGDLFGYGSFRGEIALLRYYEDLVLDESQVGQQYAAVVSAPEPGTALLVGAGLALLGLGRRRDRGQLVAGLRPSGVLLA